MNNKITYFVLAGVIVLAVIFFLPSKPASLGGFTTATVTNSSTSIGMTDTVLSTPANYQYGRWQNIGTGQISCGFNATSTALLTSVSLNTGLHFNPVGSSTLTIFETYDNNLLAKYMHCIADTTSTLSGLRY